MRLIPTRKQFAGWSLPTQIWVIVGYLTIAGMIIQAVLWFTTKAPPSPPPKTRVGEIDIRQSGKSMQDVTGADLSPGTNDMELGKVYVEQEAESMRNVTGVRMHADNSSGTVELKDKMTIKRKTPTTEGSVRFNPDAGKIKVFSREEDK